MEKVIKTGNPIDPEHYKKGNIQPLDFIVANNMNFVEGSIIKYVVRYKYKNGLEDLKKARTYLDLLISQNEVKA